ncbi:hypothetical protein GIB67_019340, partial [Kingdonia uniflora]
ALDSTKLVFKERKSKDRESEDRLALYVLRNRKYVTIEMWRCSPPKYFDAIMFTPSLVSPRDICAGPLGKNCQAIDNSNFPDTKVLDGHQMYKTTIGKKGSKHYEEKRPEVSKPSEYHRRLQGPYKKKKYFGASYVIIAHSPLDSFDAFMFRPSLVSPSDILLISALILKPKCICLCVFFGK